MMMFGILPLFAVILVLFFSGSLARAFFGRKRKGERARRGGDFSRRDDGHFSASQREPSRLYERMQVAVFRLAARNRGRLTLSDVVVETGMDLKSAEQLLDRMVDSARVRIDVNDNGMIFYEFPEIVSRIEHEEG